MVSAAASCQPLHPSLFASLPGEAVFNFDAHFLDNIKGTSVGLERKEAKRETKTKHISRVHWLPLSPPAQGTERLQSPLRVSYYFGGKKEIDDGGIIHVSRENTFIIHNLRALKCLIILIPSSNERLRDISKHLDFHLWKWHATALFWIRLKTIHYQF